MCATLNIPIWRCVFIRLKACLRHHGVDDTHGGDQELGDHVHASWWMLQEFVYEMVGEVLWSVAFVL
jgi:hypothetical protein